LEYQARGDRRGRRREKEDEDKYRWSTRLRAFTNFE
jgi:hypothetical protein